MPHCILIKFPQILLPEGFIFQKKKLHTKEIVPVDPLQFGLFLLYSIALLWSWLRKAS